MIRVRAHYIFIPRALAPASRRRPLHLKFPAFASILRNAALQYISGSGGPRGQAPRSPA